MKIKLACFRFSLGIIALGLLVVQLNADIVTLYDGEQGDLATDLAAFGSVQDLGNGTDYGVQQVASPFGTGDAIRVFDNNNGDKPDLQGEFSAPLTDAFRIDFQSLIQNQTSSSSAIRFRMANSGKNLGTESRTAMSLSWQANGQFNAKYSGVADGNGNDVDTKSLASSTAAQNITMVANGAATGDYSYTLFGESRTLNAQHYDVFVDGVLLNDGTNPDFANGMQFTLENSSAEYNPSLGLQRFGLFGSGNSNVDPDVLFDNIVLRTGFHITAVPEPGSACLFLGALASFGYVRRRK